MTAQFYERFLGRELEMNDHRAIIVGDLRGDADVPVERGRLHDLLPGQAVRPPGAEDPLLRPGEDRGRAGRPRRSPRRIQATDRAEGPDQRGVHLGHDQLLHASTPASRSTSGSRRCSGFLVGTAIAGQTFYNFTIENLKQFGALKAMGATNVRIVGMILLQATVVGLLGYGIGRRPGGAVRRGDAGAASWPSTPPGSSCRSPAGRSS